MYCNYNFKKKSELKAAVASGHKVGIFQPNEMFSNPKSAPDYTGKAYLEGPHYPAAHSWYAEVELVNGFIVKVK